MSRWIDQYTSHPFHNNWGQLTKNSSAIPSKWLTNETNLTEVSRLRKVIEFIESQLTGIDPEIFPMSLLTSSNQQLLLALNHLNAFISSGGLTSIQNANNHLDSIVHAFSQIQSVPKGGAKRSLTAAVKAYDKSINQYISFLGSEKNRISEEFKSFVASQKQAQNELSLNIDKIEARINANLSTSEKQNSEFMTQFQNSETERRTRFEDEVKNLKEKADNNFTILAKKSTVTLEVMDEYLEQVKRVMEVVLNTAQAGAYNKYANKEKRSADILRTISILLMGLAVSVLIAPDLILLYNGAITDIDITKTLLRVPISALVFAPAFYLAKESSRHRENAIKNRRRELVITTIGPYLELLDNEDTKEQIKKDVAAHLFTDNSTVGPFNLDDSAGNLVAQLTNFMKSIPGKN